MSESEIIKPDEPKAPRKSKFDFWLLLFLLYGIFHTTVLFLPGIAVFGLLALVTQSAFWLVLAIIMVVVDIGATIYVIVKFIQSAREPDDQSGAYPISTDSGDSDEAAKAAGLIFGAGLLGHHIGKHHKSASDRAADDWLWQEKYRDD